MGRPPVGRPPPFPDSLHMSASVRIALIGNSFAEAIQLPALRYAGNNEVVGLAGGDGAKARATADRWGIPVATDDWTELLTLAPDLVIVSTPVDLHYPMARAALECGAAVLCEKPFTLNVHEAADLEQRARGRLALIDHQLRWNPTRRKLRELLRANFVGEVFHVRSDLVLDNPAFLERPFGWWFDAARGGGALGALGSHLVDNVLWMFGPIAAVQAHLAAHVPQRPDADGVLREVTADDTAELRLELQSGLVVQLTTSVVMPGASRWLLEVCGSEGTLRLDLDCDLVGGRHGEDMRQLDPETPMPDPSEFGMDRGGAFAACEPLYLKDVVSAVARGDAALPEAASFTDGLACMRVLDAARRSSALGGVRVACT